MEFRFQQTLGPMGVNYITAKMHNRGYFMYVHHRNQVCEI